ncbi:MAG TPA: hypothetical protein VF960_07295 [Chloroflexota bacterium]
MIIITPDAAEQLRTMEVDGSPAKLEFTAEDDGDGGYNCSVALVGESTPGAELQDVDGVPVSFRGMATTVFAGAVLGLNAEGELTLEMAEGDCDSCGEGGCGCGDDSCGCGGH